jgi:hypothetical protein
MTKCDNCDNAFFCETTGDGQGKLENICGCCDGSGDNQSGRGSCRACNGRGVNYDFCDEFSLYVNEEEEE